MAHFGLVLDVVEHCCYIGDLFFFLQHAQGYPLGVANVAWSRVKLHTFCGTRTQIVNCADFSNQTVCQEAMASNGCAEEDNEIYAFGF